jgi:hypothetical protein
VALTLLTRPGCCLCEEFLDEFRTLAAGIPLPDLVLVDVDSDAVLARRYGLDIPVLLLDGVAVCRHRLDREELLRLLRRR